jgi:DNA polymerase, archaea type
MQVHTLDSWEHIKEFRKYVEKEGLKNPSARIERGVLKLSFSADEEFHLPDVWSDKEKVYLVDWLSTLSTELFTKLKSKRLIFGKNNLERIVSCEVQDTSIELFLEHADGSVTTEVLPNKYWLLASRMPDKTWEKLEGNLHYKWMKSYTELSEFLEDKRNYFKCDLYSIYDTKEAAMVLNGFTYFKGMKVEDVSVLAFDIESTGIDHNDKSRVLLISNTFRRNGKLERKLFAVDEFKSEADMFDSWCEWVRTKNPAIMIGHNIFGYDLPYMNYCAEKAGTSLNLGRDGSKIRFDDRASKFRKDGSQDYEYHRAFIYGREIVDTMFRAYQYDFARKYENYGLKQIIKQEGLEIAGRQFYDASQIHANWHDAEERRKIKLYAEHDADDALALYDLMIPAVFYLNQSVPKSFQSLNYSASGSQINAFLIRSYIQDGHSIPKATEAEEYEGAISFGNAGIYKNVYKVDVASLYPSIMLQYSVYDPVKDPKAHFLKMVEYFTNERLANKKKGKETGDRYYKDVEQAQKIVINSAYGMMGATLNFNSPKNAAFVTRKGREILQQSIDWAQSQGFKIVNADTDSISFCKSDMGDMDEAERTTILKAINAMYPERIRFEDDGYYPSVVVVKAKNYILYDGKKVKTKGSALKATMKEKALQEFIKRVTDCLVFDKVSELPNIYNEYIKEIYNLQDITRWSAKKTVTDSVLNPERTNEQKVLEAIGENHVQMGDKIYVYFTETGALKLQENWDKANPDHDKVKLAEKVFKTISVFEPVLDMNLFPNYKLVRNQNTILRDLLGLPPIVKEKKPRKKKEELQSA